MRSVRRNITAGREILELTSARKESFSRTRMAFPLALKLFDLDMFGSVPFGFDQHCKIFDFMMPI